MQPANWFVLVSLAILAAHPMAGAAADPAAEPGEVGLAQRLAGGDRAEADKQRDPGRKPADVVAFLGVEPGSTVVDLIAAGGYYTEVLSLAVQGGGTVYAQNPPRVLEFRDGANDKAMTKRLEGDRLPNVQRLDLDLSEVKLAPGTVDFAITALNFHDIYNGSGSAEAQAFLAHVSKLLKPGGVLGVIDHSGSAGNDNAKLHRIEEQKVREAGKQAGFEVVEGSDLLRNPADDLSTGVFDPAIRGHTDRFLLKFRKPM
ncbi:MAG TPA: methyltransferase [Myxococcales bacterium]|nr:methyltransferase [Myxococcales bacterium]